MKQALAVLHAYISRTAAKACQRRSSAIVGWSRAGLGLADAAAHVNPYGGAIALGMSGAPRVLTATEELQPSGIAMVIERV